MRQRHHRLLATPYYLWMLCFVIVPIALLVYQSMFDIHGQWTWDNYRLFFTSFNYLKMTFNSFVIAGAITLLSLLFTYPMAYLLTKTKHKMLWSLLVILPTWINLLLKVYAFIGILSQRGPIVHWLNQIGLNDPQLLFTNTAFILVAVYIEIPFMLLPIFNSIDEIPASLIEASQDLGASTWQTLWRIIVPLSLPGVRSGVQTVFIPSLSLFMLARLIGGNRVITLGTAVEEHFMVTQNWGMGATIGVVLMLAMAVILYLTRERQRGGHGNETI